MKKFFFHSRSLRVYTINKGLLLMLNWGFFFMFALCLKVSANGYSQNNRVSLDIKNMEFRKALSVLEKKGKIHFLYGNETIPARKEINLSANNEPVLDVLERLLRNTGLKYKILNDELVVIAPIGSDIRDITVRGQIVDESGKPLANVSIQVEGSKTGVMSDAAGMFEISAPENGKLVFSFVGYIEQTVPVSNKTRVDVVLKLTPLSLNEVVVVGYGTQKRADITGAVASVPKSRLSQIPSTNVLQMIEGSVAGLSVTTNNSVPGSQATVLVRGQNSITANAGPFIVVDGIPFSTTGGNTNDINPNDIASIEVLKDASAVAIYGTRGSQGVILITTKRGLTGKPVIRYNAYVGAEDIPHILKPRNAQEYLQKYADYWSQTSTLPLPSPVPNYSELVNYNAGKTTDWIKETTQTGVVTDNNLSISGGTKDVKYYVSGEYMKEKGVVKGYQYHRASFRSNLDINVTDYLTAGTSMFLTANNYDGGTANLLFASAMSPYGQEYNADGTYAIYPMYPELLYTNPLIGLYTDVVNRTNNLNGNFYAELKPGGILKGLKFRINASDSYIPTRYDSYTGRAANNTLGTAYGYNKEWSTWVIENILTYTRDFNKHHIDFTGLYSGQRTKYFIQGVSATGFINDLLSFNNIGAGATISAANNLPDNTPTTGSYSLQSSIVSQMGRFNYTYDSRFLLTLTARRDGYSAFGVNKKYGLFPSAAVGWNVSNESFMKSVSWLDNLKIRASYGKSGNQAVPPYLTSSLDGTVRYPFNGVSSIGVTASSLGNANLHWESTVGFNAGIDFALMKGRITGSLDAYRTHTYDLLLKRNLPNVTGYTFVYDNLGKTANRGIELTLNTRNIDGKDFRWESTIAVSANHNEIVDLYGDKKSDVGNRWFIGKPVNVVYDYKMTGIWQTGEDASKTDPGAKPGDLKFADINGDGKITADSDKVVLGQTAPKWYGSFTNTFHYKNFHLNIFIQTAQGMTKNNPDLNYVDESGRRNTPAEIGYWTATNKNNSRPALSYTNTRGYGYATDAGYTRIKDITLSYTVPQKLLDKAGLGSLTLYVSGRNLYTFTNWIGWDPENDYLGRGVTTATASWTNNYPVVRSVVFGANISLR